MQVRSHEPRQSSQLTILLYRKHPVFVRSMETAVEISGVFAKERYAHLTQPLVLITHLFARLCPVFQLSNVTGEGLDYVSVLHD